MRVEQMNLEFEIERLNDNIIKATNYLRKLRTFYIHADEAIEKYEAKIQSWKKERYELKKELAVLANAEKNCANNANC